jgi:hypothetical protein
MQLLIINSLISYLNAYVYYQYSTILLRNSAGNKNVSTKKLSELTARWQTRNINITVRAARMLDLSKSSIVKLLLGI